MPVTLRIRIVQIKGPDERLANDITIRCGYQFFRLSPQKSEWCVFSLESSKEEVVFQSIYRSTSCRCNEIDGRKRIDFPDGVSLLVEGFWFVQRQNDLIIQSSPAPVRETSRVCEISFTSTRTCNNDTLILPDSGDIFSSRTSDSRSAIPSEFASEDDHGPVSKALQWIQKSAVESRRRSYESANRVQYEPKEKCRLNWDPALTAMDDGKTHGRDPEITEALRGVNISLNLSKMYMIAPDL